MSIGKNHVPTMAAQHIGPEIIGLDTSALFSMMHALEDQAERIPQPIQLSGKDQALRFRRLIQVYADINKLIIPSHVDLEYKVNQESVQDKVIASITQWGEKVNETILLSESYASRFCSDDSYQYMEELGQKYLAAVRTFQSAREKETRVLLEQYHKCIKKWIKQAVKEETATISEVESLNEKAKIRFSNGTPPGYCDNSKNEAWPSAYAPKLPFHRKFGDFYIWDEFLRIVERKRPSSVVFITSDMKDDWWEKRNPAISGNWEGRKELIEEFDKRVENCSFQLTTPIDAIQTNWSQL